jgi:ribonuclease E
VQESGVDAPNANDAAVAEPAASPEPAVLPESVEILDIPVQKSTRNRRPVSKQVTDELFDSVLDSLPEPKQPGQGRSRSRRVTTAGGSTAAVQPIITPGTE